MILIIRLFVVSDSPSGYLRTNAIRVDFIKPHLLAVWGSLVLSWIRNQLHPHKFRARNAIENIQMNSSSHMLWAELQVILGMTPNRTVTDLGAVLYG